MKEALGIPMIEFVQDVRRKGQGLDAATVVGYRSGTGIELVIGPIS